VLREVAVRRMTELKSRVVLSHLGLRHPARSEAQSQDLPKPKVQTYLLTKSKKEAPQ